MKLTALAGIGCLFAMPLVTHAQARALLREGDVLAGVTGAPTIGGFLGIAVNGSGGYVVRVWHSFTPQGTAILWGAPLSGGPGALLYQGEPSSGLSIGLGDGGEVIHATNGGLAIDGTLVVPFASPTPGVPGTRLEAMISDSIGARAEGLVKVRTNDAGQILIAGDTDAAPTQDGFLVLDGRGARGPSSTGTP